MMKYNIESIRKELKEIGLEMLDEFYNGVHDYIKCRDANGYIVMSQFCRIKKEVKHLVFSVSNPYTIDNIRLWLLKNNVDTELISTKFEGCKQPLNCRCKTKGCLWEIPWSLFQRDPTCPYCTGRVNYIDNRLITQRPDLIKYFKSEEEASSFTTHSGRIAQLECYECGYEKRMKVCTLSRQGFSCNQCSDGISLPEKFTRSFLNQLKIQYIAQKKFQFSGNKKYDFYVPSLNMIIEVHGRQHYEDSNRGKRTLIEEQANDKIKYELAVQNGIQIYVVIDCSLSEFNWLKQNLVKELSEYFNMTNIEWDKIWLSSLSSLVIQACNLWNEGQSIKEIIILTKISRSATISYLKRGSLIGICDYNPQQVMIETGRKIGREHGHRAVIQYTKEGEYVRQFRSIKEATESIGMKNTNISRSCRSVGKTVGGYLWRYVEER